MASIINIRGDLHPDAAAAFGQFLGFFSISHAVPPGISLRQLAEDVHRETARVKTEKLYLRTIMGMRMVALLWRFLSRERRHSFYQKHFPLWAGVTTLNVNRIWAGVPDYYRAASASQSSPLVFVITTVGETVNVAVTFRTAAFSKETVDRVIREFQRGVAALDGGDAR